MIQNHKRALAVVALLLAMCTACLPGDTAQPLVPREYLVPKENIFSDRSHSYTGGGGDYIDTRGFLSVEDGHFYFEDGQRAKFWGVNIAFEGCMPQQAEARRMAAELEALGVNAVRLLSFDTDYTPSVFVDAKDNTLAIDSSMLDRMDYFIACLKDVGIYTVLSVHTERNFTENDGVTQAGELPSGGKYASLFDARLITLQKNFAQVILTHENPYTGLAYARDPAIALYQVTNENSLFSMWYNGEELPEYYETQLDEMFLGWLEGEYGDPQAAIDLWGNPAVLRPRYKERDNYSPEQIADLMRFYVRVEEDYADDMLDFYRNDLGVEAPICVNTAYSGDLHLISTAAQDFTSAHMYYDYMEFSDGAWNMLDFRISNASMLQTDSDVSDNITSLLGMISFSALEGKPMVLDEYNSIYPNDYQYEIVPVVTAYAGLQDWDGLFLFSYSYGETGKTIGKHTGRRDYAINDFFIIENNAVKVAQMRACATMFLRGDVAPAQTFYTLETTHERCLEDGDTQVYTADFNNYGLSDPVSSVAVYTHGLRRSLTADTVGQTPEDIMVGESPAVIQSDTGQLSWYSQEGRLVIDTPQTVGVVGNLSSRTQSFGSCTIETENGGGVLLTSLDGDPLGQSGHMLLSAAGKIENTGTLRNTKTGGLKSWGEDAIDVEGICGRVTLQTSQPGGGYVVYGLSADQVRLSRETVTADADGLLQLELAGEYLCYEIEAVLQS